MTEQRRVVTIACGVVVVVVVVVLLLAAGAPSGSKATGPRLKSADHGKHKGVDNRASDVTKTTQKPAPRPSSGVTRDKVPRDAGAKWCPQSLVQQYGHRDGSETWDDRDMNNGNSKRYKATLAMQRASGGRIGNVKEYKSLTGEEVWVMQRFFGDPVREGMTYIELGAVDGRTFSNTYVLDKYYKWKGLLIEASPENFRTLPDNRPSATTIHGAVCREPGQIKFYGRGPVASQQFKEGKKEYTVPCQPMRAYEAEAGLTDVAFFSIDVEGAEVLVVETHDWDKVPVSVVITEALWQDSDWEKNKEAREALAARGLCLLAQDVGHENEVWLNEWWWTNANDPVNDWPPTQQQRDENAVAVAQALAAAGGGGDGASSV